MLNGNINYIGPVTHLVNLRPPTTPTTSRQGRSSIRPVARTSDVDFDRIPSPHPPNSTRRGAGHAGPGPSNLRHSARESDPETDSQSESENQPVGDYSGGGGYDNDDVEQGGFDDYGPQESPESQRIPRQSNFSTIEEADEEEEEEPEGVEDEIAQGLEDVGLDIDSQEEESEHEPEPPVKKSKLIQEKKATTKTQTRSKKENRRLYLLFLHLPILF